MRLYPLRLQNAEFQMGSTFSPAAMSTEYSGQARRDSSGWAVLGAKANARKFVEIASAAGHTRLPVPHPPPPFYTLHVRHLA